MQCMFQGCYSSSNMLSDESRKSGAKAVVQKVVLRELSQKRQLLKQVEMKNT